MSKEKITVVGAGLAGLVAAINLLREGFEVDVWDGARKLGQLEAFHPSIHATPIDPARVSAYIGVDVSGCFTRVETFRIVVKNRRYALNPQSYHLVERGGRKTSIDTHLYETAKEMGARFHFDHYIRNLKDVPERAVVATGFNKEGMEALGIAYEEGTGAYARKKLDDPALNHALIGWAGDYTPDYGYLSVANGLMFFLVFTRHAMTDRDVDACKRHLEETEGLVFDNWDTHKGYIPLLDRNSLRLFKGSRVLTGTISGMIDPAGMFGIHGALMAGKIAALVFTDTEKALDDFRTFTRNYQRVRVLSGAMRKIPMRLALTQLMFRFPWVMSPVLGLLDDGIPGYEGHWGMEMMKGRKRL